MGMDNKIDNIFTKETSDLSFLVAKGKFSCPSEPERQRVWRERDILLTQCADGKNPDVIALTRQIQDLDKLIDKERYDLEHKHVKNLATAIFMRIKEHGDVKVRSIGAKATYNAVKSIAIASNNCSAIGVDLNFGTFFDDGNLGHLRDKGHVNNITAILFKLKGFVDKQGD